jgi:hypothetical protein
MNVEIGEVNLFVFVDDRVHFKSLRIQLIYHLGLKIREYELAIRLSGHK